MSDQREKRVDLILQQLDQLPTLPAVAVRVLQGTSDQSTDAADVVALIESDPSLTARILQLVHRADSGVRGEVATVERAVVLLGFDAVRSAVLAVSVFEMFHASSNAAASLFSREEFWKHSIAVACAAELLAASLPAGTVDPSEAFICGLLHDLGKIAFDAALPKSFARVVEAADLLRGNIADVERNVIGLDHMVVGKRLAERWQLPAQICDCIWLHGQAPVALPASVGHPKLINLITLADLLVREQHLGYSGNFTFPISRQSLCEAIGLSSSKVEAALTALVNHIESRAAALGLNEADAGALYRSALAQANRELGRIGGQLAAKNRRLTIRAKFFDALSNFQGELRPDASPDLVLRAVAQTAVATLGVSDLATFSLPPGRDYAETIVVNQAGEVFDSSLVDLMKPQVSHDLSQAIAGLTRPPGDGPVLATGAELEWFLSAISPRLSGDQRFWIALHADAVCVGGVVWGAAAGESTRLSPQAHELVALASAWSLALRTAQIRDEAKTLAEQLAESNRQLHNAQEEVIRSKMMVSVGEMAAGAAHEMNNPLAVISGRSQLLSNQLSDPRQKTAAKIINDQAHRLSDIITELMNFAKPVPPKLSIIEPAELVNKALHEAKDATNPVDRKIEVTFGDVPLVMVDTTQVTAALTEVMDNAIQATDEKSGQIDIHAAFDPYSNRVVIIVQDNGNGMDEPTMKRAFDPFFSAKPAGRRRGMGLAKALRWVEASNGSIRLESRLGQGTRIMVLLPAHLANQAVQDEAQRKQA